ncbi:MAG: epoxyqueuosine reductase QueH [Planctomycetia bacterium]|nr:epoxyqueuosine reductase QueH [Planctomycetia bacterium]
MERSLAAECEILLHICCAPCGVGCVERLLNAGRKVRLYYSNSNIATREEFDKRLEWVRWLAEKNRLVLEVDTYDHAAWLQAVQGLEQEPEQGKRCQACFGWSLAQTAQRARELGCTFTTTLTISPHKSSSILFAVGKPYPHFEPIDFKKQNGFLRGRQLAKEYGFYLQNFCGCEFSLRSCKPRPAQ